MRSRKLVTCMARRKVVFVIVEGPSDETALGAILSRLFDEKSVYLHVMRQDITTENGVNASNIVPKLGNIIRKYAKDYCLAKTHFQEIIHLVDMDGAYIPDGNVVEDILYDRPLYGLREIRTAKREGILLRNQQKCQNLDRLCGLSEIWGLPYQIYYMSCNLDHVLYDKQNSTDEEKEQDSYAFAKKYKDIPTQFVKYISESDFAVIDDYKTSWEFIKTDLHSLGRYSNFGLCFQDLKAPMQGST